MVSSCFIYYFSFLNINMENKMFSSREERDNFIRNQVAAGVDYDVIVESCNVSKATISRAVNKTASETEPVSCETEKHETFQPDDVEVVSRNETKLSRGVKSNETEMKLDLTDDERLVYDYLRKISPLVAGLGNLPTTKVDINKVLLSLQSKVNKGFKLNINTKVYEGESIDAMVCNQFRYRNSCLGCEPTLGSFGVDVVSHG